MSLSQDEFHACLKPITVAKDTEHANSSELGHMSTLRVAAGSLSAGPGLSDEQGGVPRGKLLAIRREMDADV